MAAVWGVRSIILILVVITFNILKDSLKLMVGPYNHILNHAIWF